MIFSATQTVEAGQKPTAMEKNVESLLELLLPLFLINPRSFSEQHFPWIITTQFLKETPKYMVQRLKKEDLYDTLIAKNWLYQQVARIHLTSFQASTLEGEFSPAYLTV